MEEAASFVSKARTAFHSAAAKAERVLSDLKSDRGDSDKHSTKDLGKRADDEPPENEGEIKSQSEPKHSRWRPAHIGTKQDWQDRFKKIGIGKKGGEDSEKVEAMSVPFYDENLYLLNMKNDLESKHSELIPSVESFLAVDREGIPPLFVIKQLATAVETGKKYKSIKDFLASPGDSSPAKERSGLSLSAVKSLVLREKEERSATEFLHDERVCSLIYSLFDAEGDFLKRNLGYSSEGSIVASLSRDIHGAPPQSLLVKISEVMGNFKNLRKMALFWRRVVSEMRRLWSEEQYIPGIPLDETPDLNSCLLYQKFQVINCCISRKRRRETAIEKLESLMSEASCNADESAVSKVPVSSGPILFARVGTGEFILRLGADQRCGDLKMLETGEAVYSPVTQEGPLLTEDVIKETEEFILRTGSVGAGCSQLLSDMQAFKAANPGCILEDFVRWHSPPDWTESEPSTDTVDSSVSGDLRGQLSSRMQKEGNLWRELWETSKPVPAVKQAPLYDEDLAVEGILNDLEGIPPSELFQQLFVSLVGLGFVVGEGVLANTTNLSKLFFECKEYVVTILQGGFWSEKIEEICRVYETLEAMILNPEEVLRTMMQSEEPTATAGEPKSLFKKLNLNFGSKDKHLRKLAAKQNTSEEHHSRQPFSSFFDSKSSLFSKKPAKHVETAPADLCSVESEWMIV